LKKDILKLTDEELIKEFQDNNNAQAFEILAKRYKDPLVNFIYRFLGDKEAAIDIAQDALLRFYLNKDAYKSFAKFSTWIYTIAGNLAKNELKRRRRRQLFSINSAKDDEQDFDIKDVQNLNPDILADAVIKNKFIQKALMKLNPIYREAVILRDIQDLPYEEIAKILNLSIGTVKSRINRGRAILQKYLKSIYKEN
jgi:RNA polymerase sigma-70 factor (ECF subfamily)